MLKLNLMLRCRGFMKVRENKWQRGDTIVTRQRGAKGVIYVCIAAPCMTRVYLTTDPLVKEAIKKL